MTPPIAISQPTSVIMDAEAKEMLAAATSTSFHSSRRRDERLDFLRGTCIFGMVIWHLLSHDSFPKWFSLPIIQGFNFVAEGFILLAGVGVGLGFVRQDKQA